MKTLPYPLETLTYYLTILAVGSAGVLFAFEQHHPARWAILALALLFGATSTVGFTPRITQNSRYVHSVLALQTLLVVALLGLAPEMTFFIIWFYMMSVYAVLALPRRAAYAWIAGFSLLSVAVLVIFQGVVGGLVSAFIYASGFAFFAAFAQLTHRAQQARAESERLLAELQAAHRQLQDYAARVEELAVAEERNRLAREMHDTLGHRLTVAAVQLEAAERLIPTQPERAASMVATVRDQVRAALTELRRTVAALRQPVDDLPAALQTLAARFTAATGLPVTVNCQETSTELPAAHRLLLYRAAQEGLTNVQRHARARQAWLRLTRQRDGVLLSLEDDGVGPPPNPSDQGGIGLRGMAEQAQRLGGYAHLSPRAQGGARLDVYLPLPAEDAP